MGIVRIPLRSRSSHLSLVGGAITNRQGLILEMSMILEKGLNGTHARSQMSVTPNSHSSRHLTLRDLASNSLNLFGVCDACDAPDTRGPP